MIEVENAVILPNIVNKTRKDKKLQDVIDRIQNSDWEKYKKRQEILPVNKTRKDKKLQDVIDRIQNSDWEKYKKRQEILPFYIVRDE